MLVHRRRRVSGSVSALLAVMAAVFVAPAALAAPRVYISVNAGGSILKVRPSSIHLVSSENLLQLSWTSWGGRSASASGLDHGNAPSPGHSATNPVEVTATSRKRCAGKFVYTTIRLHFTAGVPYEGQPSNTKYAYGCPPNAARACRSFRVPGLRTAVRVRVKRGSVSCRRAMQIMRDLFAHARPNVQGWSCVGPQTGYAACKKGNSKITASF
jgi:hypothetical protein